MPAKKKSENALELTPFVEEGPYYTPGSPERNSIAAPGTYGKKLILTGRVLDKDGKPVAKAWLDFWQADGRGEYDNAGFNLRGRQYTDKDGRYRLETVRPVEYQVRSPHIHVKVRANDNAPVLTAQLFFPGVKSNAGDFLFEPGTVVTIKDSKDVQTAAFDFVVET
jgi:protocatechuate 3,4-dioxygenase beta subunit